MVNVAQGISANHVTPYQAQAGRLFSDEILILSQVELATLVPDKALFLKRFDRQKLFKDGPFYFVDRRYLPV